jgi:hypothetical protein
MLFFHFHLSFTVRRDQIEGSDCAAREFEGKKQKKKFGSKDEKRFDFKNKAKKRGLEEIAGLNRGRSLS